MERYRGARRSYGFVRPASSLRDIPSHGLKSVTGLVAQASACVVWSCGRSTAHTLKPVLLLAERMHPFEMTRALIDMESITENEKQVGEIPAPLSLRAGAGSDGRAEAMPVTPERLMCTPNGAVPSWRFRRTWTRCPPFIESREDDDHIYGRGACDAKGIIAAMIASAEKLIETGTRNFALLFVVGEERNSAGAHVASLVPRGSRYLINGEPTESTVALGSKGILRYEIVATG